MTMQEAVKYLIEHDRGCTVFNGNTIYVFHRGKRIGALHGELIGVGALRRVEAASVYELAQTTAAS